MSTFQGCLWPEEPTPYAQINCCECGLDTHSSRMIWGEGNPVAPILVLLDNPGAREDREGSPKVCGTRQTLQHAASHVGLDERDLYVTYILKRRPVRAYDKNFAREKCMNHLYDQLEEKKPLFIMCLGNVATQSFFQDQTAEVKSLRGKIHEIRGFKTTVAYHPLAVRRRPNLWSNFLEDWRFLANTYTSR